MERVPDALDLFNEHERRQQQKLDRLPVCDFCEEPIQDDHFFLINDEMVCPECLKREFRRRTEDYIE